MKHPMLWSASCTTILMLGLAMSLMIIPGCGDGDKISDVIKQNKEQILKVLTMASKRGTEAGLNKWAEKKPDAAKEAATALSRNLEEQILPYLDGEDLHTSEEVNEFVNSSLFKDVPDEVKDAIVAAAIILDIYLPIPGSDNLSDDHKDYLRAFLTGIKQGASKFVSDAPQADGDKRYWITGGEAKAGGGDSARLTGWIDGLN